MRKAFRAEVSPLGGRLWLGVAILLLGVLWTLDNLNILESEPILGWWPLILIAVGATKLAGWGGPANPVAGGLWLGFGIVLLLMTQRLLPWRIWELWPIFLIAFGGAVVWRALQGPQLGVRVVTGADGESGEAAEVTGPPQADLVSAVAVWSGVDRKSTSRAFRGGDFTAWMGGGDIDLRGARTAPEGAVIEVFVLMGGLEVRVPEDWNVVNEIFAFMGGVEDSRKSIAPAGANVLYLKGAVIMGGVEVKN